MTPPLVISFFTPTGSQPLTRQELVEARVDLGTLEFDVAKELPNDMAAQLTIALNDAGFAFRVERTRPRPRSFR